METLENCQQGTKKLWNVINSCKNLPKPSENQSIIFNNTQYDDPKKIAAQLNKQYTPGSDKKPSKEFRNKLRHLKKKPKNTPDINFTEDQVKSAIKRSKNSKALGPDDLSPQMLKNIGNNGIKYLTKIYNKVVNTATIPNSWKIGRIIPILKPGKPANEGKSYRPISLLSPTAKILESLIQVPLREAIPLADHQHGFRKGRSTTTALQAINSHITKNLNIKKPANRTVVVALDLSRAFDTVDHEILLQDILELNINHNIKKFLSSYLRGRQTFVEFRGTRSKCRVMKQGVPQGGVLSPLLFNLYMSKIPSPPGNIVLVTYADDGQVMNSGPKYEPVCHEINSYLDVLHDWFESRNLQLSPGKSSATLFTTWPNEKKEVLPIKIKGNTIPTTTTPTFLGVTYDSLMKFNHHATKLRTRLQERNNILKALSGTSWGKEKEVIITTYQALGQSLLNYACPIWTPNLAKCHWDNLQACQNTALKTALGCVKMSPFQHVHTESKILPVKTHCQMLTKQFILSTQMTEHPNQVDISGERPRYYRHMVNTLSSEHGDEIRDYLTDVELNENSYRATLKKIHTDTVSKTIQELGPNNVLNTKPPEIHQSERELPRSTRSTLSQLRCGYSTHLHSYMSRINNNYTNNCPKCNITPHDTEHLFNCPENHENLDIKTLWTNPKQAAAFLGLDLGEERQGVG